MEQQSIMYLGKKWPIKATINPDAKKITCVLKEDFILLESKEAGQVDYTNALITFYKKLAKKHIENRLRYYQPMIGKKYKSVTIESIETRWGSCNSKGELTFHWKLMVFPEKAIDYVVIHELCHLMHMNHDRSFWRLVGKLCPEYKAIMPIIGTEKV